MLTKEPTEVKLWTVNWADWLGALTISTSTWNVPSGITKDNDSKTATTTSIQVSGGTWGAIYELFNTVIANNGETETRSIIVKIQRSVSYATTLELRARATQATVNTLPNSECEALIDQASRMVDLECGASPEYFSPFPIPIATSRIFYGDGTNFLRLDPYVAGSLNPTLTMPAGYTVPAFIERNGYLVPVTSTGIQEGYYNRFSSAWPIGVPVTTSGIWGWRETPNDIKMAVIELAINLWRETDPAAIKLVNIEGQPLREKMPPRVLEVARKYRLRTARAFFV